MSKKIDASKLQGVFEKILESDPENRFCADCHCKNPRWASTNLGVFICIKCAGIHRSIGTHVTKVKSISLDSWEESQIAVMRKVGNTNGRRIWEATMSESVQRERPNENASSSVLDHWIRAKYERKMYFSQAAYDEVFNGAPRAAAAAAPASRPAAVPPAPSSRTAAAAPSSGGIQSDSLFGPSVAAPAPSSTSNSFDGLFGAPVSAPPASSAPTSQGRPRAPSGGSSSSVVFGAPVSAPPKAAAAPAQQQQQRDATADLLFGPSVSAPAANTGMGMGMGMNTAPQQQQQHKDNDSIMALFGPNATSQSTLPSNTMFSGAVPLQPQQAQQAPVQQSRGNYDVDLRAYGVYRATNPQQQQQMTAQQRAYYQQQLLYQQQQQARYTPNYTRYA